jgi:glycosyltransferase involved in cell wall biosynthesis
VLNTNSRNLLIVTQKIDAQDGVLSFFIGWVKEFAKNVDKVIVICLEEGEHDLPENVTVLSLGKEKGVSRFGYLINFYRYIWQNRSQYSHVFVHMNQIYVILGGLVWRVLGKRVGFWYAHGHIPFSLRIAEILSHVVFTSTKSGFRLESKKIHVIGQGVDSSRFSHSVEKNNLFEMIIVGRISPVKDLETLIKAVEIFVEKNPNSHLSIVGGAGTDEQQQYELHLKEEVKKRNLEKFISFKGAVSYEELPSHLEKSDLFVSTSNTGSLDKAILDAMASFMPVLTCNVALEDVLGPHKEKLMFKKGDFQELASKIEAINKMSLEERMELGGSLRKIVERDHSLENFVDKILSIY